MTEQPTPAGRQIDTDVIVGARAHMLMWRGGRSQAAVSAALGMAKSQLSRKLKGERPWYAREIVEVARVLGTSVAYLIGETDDPSAPPPGLEPGTVRFTASAGQRTHMARLIRFPVRVGAPAARRSRPAGNHPVLALRVTA